ncbi:hypothetical protein SteCoe_4665 [Stentor coeruleus]|uniref:Uncharacterized protein n=1 Tax=Stentor coeruleus TaxID=5963 RepID=A0A1R2CU94_9CILI|nr:hypothetical protein SteCoe_4665 [Stentor coeruleus]
MSRRDHHGTGIKKTANRFGSSRQYGNGTDPNDRFINFINRDIVKNIDIHRDTVKRVDNLDSRKDKIPVGCTKKINTTRSQSPPQPYEITTDHITFQAPTYTSLGPPPKPLYTKSTVSKEGWVAPRGEAGMGNCQSVNYNIINFQDSPNAVIRKVTNLQAGRSKGITQFADLNRPFNPNFNEDYTKALNEEPKVFYKKTGIFSHMYDAAARHGYMTMPFEKAQENNGKPAFKC